jgi:hypothetical protein
LASSCQPYSQSIIAASCFLAVVTLGSLGCCGDPLSIRSKPLHVDMGARLIGPSGALVYRGGIELTSTDKRFGGLSGLVVSGDGREILAVSDRGWWVEGLLLYNDGGNLVGLRDAGILPMQVHHQNGASREVSLDAEALVRSGENSLIVAFERQHRLWEYRDLFSYPMPIDVHANLSRLPLNSGIESLVLLGPGKLLAIAEGGIFEKQFLAFLITNSGVVEFLYPYDDYFRPSDAALLDAERVLVLERGYNKDVGVSARLMSFQREQIEKNGDMVRSLVIELGAPVPMDNFEGLAVIRGLAGECIVYILSDDNYDRRQRTLLIMFELELWSQ